jgi:hypothetical protein
LTRAGDASRYVHQEIGYAKRAGKVIIPIVTADVASSGLGMLEGIQYISVDATDPSAALHALGARIEELASGQRLRQDAFADVAVAALVMVAIGLILIAMANSSASSVWPSNPCARPATGGPSQ